MYNSISIHNTKILINSIFFLRVLFLNHISFLTPSWTFLADFNVHINNAQNFLTKVFIILPEKLWTITRLTFPPRVKDTFWIEPAVLVVLDAGYIFIGLLLPVLCSLL